MAQLPSPADSHGVLLYKIVLNTAVLTANPKFPSPGDTHEQLLAKIVHNTSGLV